MKKLLISFAILFVLAPLQASYGFRCQTKLVLEGESKAEVLKKCGEPTEKDSRQQEVIARVNTFGVHKNIVTVDVWLYHLGSYRFVQLLQFEDDKLVSIKTLEYGEQSNPQNCRTLGHKIAKGDTKPEVMMKCGKPTHKVQSEENRVILTKAYGRWDFPIVIHIQVDEWRYSLGSTHLARILRFEEGVLVKLTLGKKED